MIKLTTDQHRTIARIAEEQARSDWAGWLGAEDPAADDLGVDDLVAEINDTGDPSMLLEAVGVLHDPDNDDDDATTDAVLRVYATAYTGVIDGFRGRGARLWVKGHLSAHLDRDGRVTALTFLPAAGDAGFFGAGTELIEGDAETVPDEETFFNSDAGVAGFFARGGEIGWEG